MKQPINNNITEDYCSFEVSKLLKEKGFDCECQTNYEYALTSKKDPQDEYSGSFGWKKGELNVQFGWNRNSHLSENKNWYLCSRSTHAVAIKWIRENFSININVFPELDKWDYNIYHLKDQECIRYDDGYNSPEEATEAALLYVLQNLIK